VKERTEKVGVEGGRSVRWTVPWPGVEAVGGKGEGIGAGGVIYGGTERLWKTSSRIKPCEEGCTQDIK